MSDCHGVAERLNKIDVGNLARHILSHGCPRKVSPAPRSAATVERIASKSGTREIASHTHHRPKKRSHLRSVRTSVRLAVYRHLIHRLPLSETLFRDQEHRASSSTRLSDREGESFELLAPFSSPQQGMMAGKPSTVALPFKLGRWSERARAAETTVSERCSSSVRGKRRGGAARSTGQVRAIQARARYGKGN